MQLAATVYDWINHCDLTLSPTRRVKPARTKSAAKLHQDGSSFIMNGNVIRVLTRTLKLEVFCPPVFQTDASLSCLLTDSFLLVCAVLTGGTQESILGEVNQQVFDARQGLAKQLSWATQRLPEAKNAGNRAYCPSKQAPLNTLVIN